MKNKLSILTVGVVIVGLTLGLAGMALVSQAAPEPLKVRKIVVFGENFVNEPAREALVKNFDGTIVKNLPLVNGMAVLLPPKAEKALSRQVGVLRVDDDVVVYALGKPTTPPGLDKNKDEEPQPPQQPSWGYTRIGAGQANNKGTGIKVGIIDSGISLKHPDLTVVGGVNAINPRKRYYDDHGHGSHVAGLVAALDNDIGVIGVASEAQLYAIKVLDRRASG
ncbi:MAG: S8 family serine peptidase, partial [Candidatus Omnitrophota bacterium]